MIAGFPFVASSFDPDARSFVQTSGATDRAEINHFVKGIRALGLWDSMVCWPLRSSQNAGTGSTAYSLGGLGTYNGTLVNGPTWAADYVDFTTDNTHMTTGISVAASPVAAMFVGKAEVDAGTNAGVFYTAGINVNGRQFGYLNSAVATIQNYFGYRDSWPTPAFPYVSLSGVSRTSREYIAFRVLSSTAARVSRNATQSASDVAVTGWDTSSPASVQFGFYPLPTPDYRLSFMSYMTVPVDNATDTAFFSLYKSTLGQGLGLP